MADPIVYFACIKFYLATWIFLKYPFYPQPFCSKKCNNFLKKTKEKEQNLVRQEILNTSVVWNTRHTDQGVVICILSYLHTLKMNILQHNPEWFIFKNTNKQMKTTKTELRTRKSSEKKYYL